MRFAVIAAGKGSRLTQEGITLPKPLVSIHGETMIERLFRLFKENQAEEIVVIANTSDLRTANYIQTLEEKATFPPIHLITKSTPGSLHSFYELSSCLEGEPFCLTTVDTIFHPQEFATYLQAFRQSDCDALMGLTDYIDDEKPLYAATDDQLRITAYHDTDEGDRYISGGIYAMRPTVLPILRKCIEEGKHRMRDFQREIVAKGLKVQGWPFSKVIDVEHVSDIQKAERLLSTKTFLS